MRRLGPRLACLLCIAIGLPKAAAQTLDYDSFEQMFHEPVTASAIGIPQRASDAPVDMDIITQDDIRRSGAASIPDVLQYVAGIDVRRYGVADEEVGLRGYNQPYNPRLLVLVDGRQVYADDNGRVTWATIPVQLAEIRQIEVIKGPNSALYGFNATSGVINIITYDPLDTRLETASLSAGNGDHKAGSAVATGQLGPAAGVRLSMGGQRDADYAGDNLPLYDQRAREPALTGAVNLDGRARLGSGIEAFLQGSASDARLAEENFAGYFDTMLRRTLSARGGLSADTRFGLLGVSAYQNLDHVSIYAPTGPVINYGVIEHLSVLQANDLIKLGADHTVRLGLDMRQTDASSPFLFRGRLGYQVISPSAMWNWRITQHLALTTAFRFDDLFLNYRGAPAEGSGQTLRDYNRARVGTTSFNAGLVYHASGLDTWRLMVARGALLPNLVDFGLQLPFGALGPVIVAGNPDVRPSIVENLELDYDRALPAIGSSLRAAVFAQRNTDLISSTFGSAVILSPSGLPLLTPTNVGASRARGGELSLKGHGESGFRWTASYAYVTTSDETSLYHGIGATSPVTYRNSVPKHVVVAGLGYTGGRLECDVFARWQSSYRDYADAASATLLIPVSVPNYLALSARAAYTPRDWLTVAVTAQQFNRSRLVETPGPPVERRFIASVTTRF